MPKTPNPLREMTQSVHRESLVHQTPDDSFAESALPGFKQALQARRSMREYDRVPMPEAVMRDCLHDATLAPSSSNLQTYELYWVRASDKKDALAHACLSQPAAMTAAELVVVVARGDLWKIHLEVLTNIMTRGGTKPLPGPLNDYYTRIVPMIMRTDPLGINNLIRRCMYWYKARQEPFMRTPINRADHRIYAHIQATLAAQTLMLSLAAHGYDSCPIGGMDKIRIATLLNLPPKAEVTMVIAAGRGKTEGIYGPRIRLPDRELIKEVS